MKNWEKKINVKENDDDDNANVNTAKIHKMKINKFWTTKEVPDDKFE